MLTLALFVAGLVALVAGAELLVRGASGLAVRIGISPLVVGLTVVSYGTSAPEAAVSVDAALHGQTALAFGNVVGSNVFNVLAILGLAALVTPLLVDRQLLRLDLPLLIVVSAGLWLLALDGGLGRWEGGLLFLGSLVYTVLLIRHGRRQTAAAQSDEPEATASDPPKTLHPLALIGLAVVGLALLVVGAEWLVNGAVAVAQMLGVGEMVIGLTVVAAGTSLPEVATSVVAGLRGERDIAVGNVVGSCLFNLLFVLGLAAAVSPEGVPVGQPGLTLNLPVMLGATLLCLPVFASGRVIERWEGGLLLSLFVAYTAYLVLQAIGSPAQVWFGPLALGLAVVAALAFVVRWATGRRRAEATPTPDRP